MDRRRNRPTRTAQPPDGAARRRALPIAADAPGLRGPEGATAAPSRATWPCSLWSSPTRSVWTSRPRGCSPRYPARTWGPSRPGSRRIRRSVGRDPIWCRPSCSPASVALRCRARCASMTLRSWHGCVTPWSLLLPAVTRRARTGAPLTVGDHRVRRRSSRAAGGRRPMSVGRVSADALQTAATGGWTGRVAAVVCGRAEMTDGGHGRQASRPPGPPARTNARSVVPTDTSYRLSAALCVACSACRRVPIPGRAPSEEIHR